MRDSGLRSLDIRKLYYGWTMLLSLSVAQAISWGILYYAFTVFLDPMRAELGWSVAEITGAYSLALLLTGLAAIPVGRWLDRRGPRLLMVTGSVLATLLVVAWSMVDSLLAFYLIWIGIGLTMAGVLYEPAFYVVAVWFERLRSRALTLLTFIGGFASVIFIPLASWLVHTYGWRPALLVLALILAVTTIPIHGLILRRHPQDMGLQPDGDEQPAETGQSSGDGRFSATLRDTLRDGGFWWLSSSFVLAMLVATALIVHLIPYLTGQGYDPGFAALAAGLVGALALPGRLIFTPLGSRIERRLVIALIFSMQTVSLIVLLQVQSRLGVLIFVALFGAGFGAITPARAALVAEFYGPAHYGSINGVMALCTTFARAAAPVGAGLLQTGFGSYTPALWILTLLSSLAAIAALRTRPHRAIATNPAPRLSTSDNR